MMNRFSDEFQSSAQTKYKLEKKIVEYQSRAVYLARFTDEPTGRAIIKQIRFNSESDALTQHKLLEYERDVLINLDHPRIPKYLDWVETEKGAALVIEHIDAPSLRQVADRYKNDMSSLGKVVNSVLEILYYLHYRRTIVHGDVKPSNILVDADNNAYLIDFGTSFPIGMTLTDTHKNTFTAGYVDRQDLGEERRSELYDLYSLGVTILCILTGVSSPSILHEQYGENLQVHTIFPNWQSEFATWIQALLDKKFGNTRLAYEQYQKVMNPPRAPAAQRQEFRLSSVFDALAGAAMWLGLIYLLIKGVFWFRHAFGFSEKQYVYQVETNGSPYLRWSISKVIDDNTLIKAAVFKNGNQGHVQTIYCIVPPNTNLTEIKSVYLVSRVLTDPSDFFADDVVYMCNPAKD